jgi:hypothetical protein
MTTRKIFFAISLAAMVLCLIAGYGIAGQWIGVVITIIIGLGWLLGLKYPLFWQ